MSERDTSDAPITPEADPAVPQSTPQDPDGVPESPSAAYDFSTIQEFLGGIGERQGVTALRERFEQWAAEAEEREQKRDAASLAMRGFFTQELEKLRSSIQVELRIRAVQQVLRDLLPLLNDLDDELRQIEGGSGESIPEALRPLVNTRRRIYAALRKLGLEQLPVTANETEFDPDLHECVETAAPGEAGGDFPPGRIIAVKRNGYFFRGDLFQTPLVVITGGH
jgi:molecular chaperone GrpE (heat shock protein)